MRVFVVGSLLTAYENTYRPVPAPGAATLFEYAHASIVPVVWLMPVVGRVTLDVVPSKLLAWPNFPVWAAVAVSVPSFVPVDEVTPLPRWYAPMYPVFHTPVRLDLSVWMGCPYTIQK